VSDFISLLVRIAHIICNHPVLQLSLNVIQLSPFLARIYFRQDLVVTNSTEDCPHWPANAHSSSQDIPRPLWKLKIYYCVHKRSKLIFIQNLMNPLHILSPYFYNIHFNIILHSTPTSFEVDSSFRFFDQSFVCISHLSNACYMPRQYSPRFITLIVFYA